MGFLDEAKQVAGQVGEAAKKGASQVQSKVEQTQTRKKADEAAKRLGYLIFKERTEGVPAGEEADRLVAEIKELERQLAEAAAAGRESDDSGSGTDSGSVTDPD